MPDKPPLNYDTSAPWIADKAKALHEAARAAVERGDTPSAVRNERAAKSARDEAAKPRTDDPNLPSYHTGGVVKKSGPANLKRGEVVVPAEKVKKMKSEGLSKPKEKKDKKKHKLHINIRPSDSGGFRADHTYHASPEDDSEVPGPEEHNLPDVKSLASHVSDSYPDMEGQAQPGPQMPQAEPPPVAG